MEVSDDGLRNNITRYAGCLHDRGRWNHMPPLDVQQTRDEMGVLAEPASQVDVVKMKLTSANLYG